ncbi:fucose isomerase [Clostridium grantii]|uniref:L-fucose isomerase n=1 Tax=Clostridium grantii DSM 8605 TaxID=1121316 RepID=A0A1M5WNM6_9CLOT|nr:fucose isomerase [Clostridium grantii]SHH89091.1 L-fucose isomerase [Clostridium grantii DSM 8605]
MSSFQVAYIPIGVPTFHLESANDQFKKSVDMMQTLTNNGVYPEKPLLTIDDLKLFLKEINPDLIVLQNNTFANSAYASEVLRAFDCPILLWTLREPVIDGGRLRLNSLTGAYSAGNVMHHLGREKFEYIFGAPTEEKVIAKINATIRAAEVKKSLRFLNVAAVGQTPQGFGFGRALDAEVAKAFGANLESIEARELMLKAKTYKKEEYEDVLAEARTKMVGLDKLPEGNVDAFARLYKAYKEFIDSKNIKALASRCWPDYFVEYGTPVCAVLGMLNDINIAASCESDLFGAISMYIGVELSGGPTFFGDPVSLDEEDNTVTFWHCGTAACSLARKDTGSEMGVHPNRKIGPTMEFGCKPADEVTIFRVGRKPDGQFRFFISTGEALDVPKQFCGTSVVIKPDTNAAELVNKSVKDGWEPHFVVIYANVAEELETLAKLLDMEVCKY